MKRILHYLQYSKHMHFLIPKSTSFSLQAFTDSDYVGSLDDRKSTLDLPYFLVLIWYLGCQINNVQLLVLPQSQNIRHYNKENPRTGILLPVEGGKETKDQFQLFIKLCYKQDSSNVYKFNYILSILY